MNLLNQTAFLNALGWSLIDSLWQMGLLWAVYTIFTFSKKVSAEQRHILAILSLSAGSLWFIMNFGYHLFNPAIKTEALAFLPDLSSFSLGIVITKALPYLSSGYLILVSVLFFRLLVQYINTRKLSSGNLSKAPAELRLFVQKFKSRIGISKNVQLWISEMVDTPMTLGFWKPIILIPLAALNNLSPSQLEAVLIHELNHIKRHDYLINLLISFVEICLFFNPFARIFSNIIRKEREHVCDDKVLQFRYDPAQYASALLILEKERQLLNPLTIAATGKNKGVLLNRIRRIITREDAKSTIHPGLVLCLLCFGFMGTLTWFKPDNAVLAMEIPVFNIYNDYITGNVKEKSEKNNPVLITPAGITETELPVAVEEAGSPAEEIFSAVRMAKPPVKTEEINADGMTATNEPVEIYEEERIQRVRFAGETGVREYTIARSLPVTTVKTEGWHPYIPKSSFTYYITEDTLHPKKLMAEREKIARESLDSALSALKGIDWKQFNQEISKAGELADIEKLQAELHKNLSRIDLNKISVELEINKAFSESFLKDKQLCIKLAEFQQERARALQNADRLMEIIILERLQNPNPPEPKKAKKTVHL